MPMTQLYRAVVTFYRYCSSGLFCFVGLQVYRPYKLKPPPCAHRPVLPSTGVGGGGLYHKVWQGRRSGSHGQEVAWRLLRSSSVCHMFSVVVLLLGRNDLSWDGVLVCHYVCFVSSCSFLDVASCAAVARCLVEVEEHVVEDPPAGGGGGGGGGRGGGGDLG